MRRAPLLALALAGAVAIAACGDSGSTTPTSIGPTTCAADDGSSPRQDHFLNIPPECLVPGKAYVATIETNFGTLHVNLRADIAPITVNSFVNLARFHYFDGTTCHRAIQNFVVQCGDPTATGTGGPGYTIPDELELIEPYRFGSIAMAHTPAPDSGGSQWFIITGENGTFLPQDYSLFGQVIDDDIAVVLAMDAIANPADGPPLQPIDIIKITVDEH